MSNLVIKTADDLIAQAKCSPKEFAQKQNYFQDFFEQKLGLPKEKASEIVMGMILHVEQSITNEKPNGILTADLQIKTFIGAVVAAVKYGLSINPAARECYFVPFKGKIQLIPTARGLIKTAKNLGMISHIETWVIYRGEQLDYKIYNGQQIFSYVPNLSTQRTWKDTFAVIIKITYPNGLYSYKHLNAFDLEKRRLTSAMAAQDVDSKDSPYKKWPEEMAEVKGIKYALSHLAATNSFLPNNLPANPAVIDETVYTITNNGVVGNEREFDDSGLSLLDRDAEKFIRELEATPPRFELHTDPNHPKKIVGCWYDEAKRALLSNLVNSNKIVAHKVMAMAKDIIENVEKNKNTPITDAP